MILAGDMNEYVQTRSVFRALDGLSDVNELAGVPPVERYTYVYEQHTQEIDHVFVSDAIARREEGVQVEHVHVNTWAGSVRERASDHDPTVVRLRVCEPQQGEYICFYGVVRLLMRVSRFRGWYWCADPVALVSKDSDIFCIIILVYYTILQVC